MEFLRYLESIRTPLGEKIFYYLTYFGEEMMILGLVGIIFWCVDKKLAYRMTFSYLLTAFTINLIKISCRVERPWIRDPEFTAVERAKASATGYSFPSGHTQGAISMYGTLAYKTRRIWLKIIFFVLIGLVMLSRMYLGVHTPEDVLASCAISAVIVILLNIAADKIELTSKRRLMVVCGIVVLAVIYITYSGILMLSGKIQYSNVSDGCKGIGAGLALALGWYIEPKYIDFDTKCKNIWMQILKAVIGAGGVFLIRAGIKAIFDANIFIDMLRYFLMMSWAFIAMPLIIKEFFQIKPGVTPEKSSGEQTR